MISVEEQIWHNFPWEISGDGTSKAQYFSGQEPPHQSNGLHRLVVAGNSNVDELSGGVNISKCNNGNVGITTLGDRLMIRPWVSDDQQPWLTESNLDLICKCSRWEATSDGAASNISCKLQNGSLSCWSCCDNIDVLGVFNSCNCTSSKLELLVGFLLKNVLLHSGLAVVRPDVGGSSQHLGDVIF